MYDPKQADKYYDPNASYFAPLRNDYDGGNDQFHCVCGFRAPEAVAWGNERRFCLSQILFPSNVTLRQHWFPKGFWNTQLSVNETKSSHGTPSAEPASDIHFVDASEHIHAYPPKTNSSIIISFIASYTIMLFFKCI